MSDRQILMCPSCHAVLEIEATVIKPVDMAIKRRSAEGRFGLTKREAQVADLVVEGYTNPAIAAELNIRTQVVKNYLCRVFDKVGCDSRTELVSMLLLGTHR